MKKLFSLIAAVAFLLASAPQAFGAEWSAQGFSAPTGLLPLEDGSLLVSDWGSGELVKAGADGKREIVATGLSAPAGLAKDGAGNIHIAGYGDGAIHVLAPDGSMRVLARGFQQPTGLLWRPNGTLLVANRGAGAVEEVDMRGQRRIVSQGHKLPVGLAITENGAIWISCHGGSVDRLAPDGSLRRISKGIATPGAGILPASADSVFVVDNAAGAVLEAGPDGAIRTLAEKLPSPVGLARTGSGGLAVATWGDGKIQTVELENE